MFVTVLGIVTLSKVKHCQNAPLPIVVTGSPLIVEGIVTSPPGPVYFVMVIAPLLVVKVNWACACVTSAETKIVMRIPSFGLLDFILIYVPVPNDCAQAGRAGRVQHAPKRRARPCLHRAGWPLQSFGYCDDRPQIHSGVTP